MIKAPLLASEEEKVEHFNNNQNANKNINTNNSDNINNINNDENISNIQKASLRVKNKKYIETENNEENNDSNNNINNVKNNSSKNLLSSSFEMNRLNSNPQNAQSIRNYQSLELKKNSLSEYELKAGSFIFAMLNHQITSDIKGDISAIVTQDVFDSTKGMRLLIPKGTQINGSYENQVAFGQSRLAVTWHRLIFSDGAIFNLGNMAGSDGGGNQGLKDQSDHHYLKTFAGAILSSILTAGVNTQQNRSSWLENGKNNLSNQVLEKTSNAAQNLIDKSLESQSTLVIRPGYRFTIKVNQDLNLK